MWDSILCGKVSQWMMEVEEEGMRQFEIWIRLVLMSL